jgi:hypothetical protein
MHKCEQGGRKRHVQLRQKGYHFWQSFQFPRAVKSLIRPPKMRVVVLLLMLAWYCLGGQVLAPPELVRTFSSPGIAWLKMDQPVVTGSLITFGATISWYRALEIVQILSFFASTLLLLL